MKFYFTLLSILFFSVLGYGQTNQQRTSTALQNNSGYAKLIPNAQITVCTYNAQIQCNTPVAVYSDSALTHVINYPFYADANGNYNYYTHPGTYIEQICSPLNQCYNLVITLISSSSNSIVLQHNGTNLIDQSLLNFNDSTPAAPEGSTNITWQSDAEGDLSGYVSSACGSNSNCVITNPTANQTIVQPQGTGLFDNNFENNYFADQYGSGSNGIQTVYGNSALCIPQGNGIPMGCTITVPSLYTNADSPQGWNTNTGWLNGLQSASGSEIFDLRNGTTDVFSRNPANPVTFSGSAYQIRADYDLNLNQRNMITSSAAVPNSLMLTMNRYNGGFDFQYYPYMTQYVGQDYAYGTHTVINNYTSGITFGQYMQITATGQGDTIGRDYNQVCDGILAGNSQGCLQSIDGITQDPSVPQGTLTSGGGVGSTSMKVNFTQDPGGIGIARLIEDISQPLSGIGQFFTSEVGPQNTGSAGNSAIMPPQVTDTNATYPVSTMIQLCNPASNNGAGGSAGCTAGSQPIGVIPPLPLTVTITGGSVSGGTGTFTNSGTQGLVAGQSVILYGFSGNGAPLNNTSATVLSSGLSSTGFEVSTSVGNITSTGAGTSTQSPTGFSPSQSVVLDVVAPYTTSGDTGGLPAGFCSSSNLQSSNSGGSCYMPTSGTGCLTDGIEYEYDNYTYNSGSQTVTITNMMFPHLNGVVFSTGGLCGYSVEDDGNLVPSGLGATGQMAPTYSIAGSVSSNTFYYVPQRTNEPYGLPTLGLSNPSNINPGGAWGAQLYFSVNSSNYSNNAGVVTFTMSEPAGAGGDPLNTFNGLVVNISTNGDSSYDGTFPITWVSGQTFTYAPSPAPSGTLPTSGTISYNHAGYSIYPAVRVTSVYNTSNNRVDGTLSTMPMPVAFSTGDTVLEAQYQKEQIGGTEKSITEFTPEDYLSTPANWGYKGFFQGSHFDGFVLNNSSKNSLFAGYGGSGQVPGAGIEIGGRWTSTLFTDAPDTTQWTINGCKPIIGCSSAASNWMVYTMPALPNAVAGSNGQDVLNYDPNYKSSSRSGGLFSGRWLFGNDSVVANTENGQLSFATVEAGYLIGDQQISTASVVSKNLQTTQLTNTPGNAPAVYGAGGSSACPNYWIVGHGIEGGTTIAHEMGVLGNQCASSFSSSNGVSLCAFINPGFSSYDFYKGNTSTLLGSATPGSGAAVGAPAPYACLLDQGQSTTAQTAPTTNTTGGANIAGPFVAYSIQQTNISAPGCAQYDSSGNLTSTGSSCGSGGGGAVDSVSNSDSSLTITPTTGAVVASLNINNPNSWTAPQTMPYTITNGVPAAPPYPASTSILGFNSTNNEGSVAAIGASTSSVGGLDLEGLSTDGSLSINYMLCLYLGNCTFNDPVVAPSYTSNGSANGTINLTSTGVTPSAPGSNTIQVTTPNSVTSYSMLLPGSATTGYLYGTASGSTLTLSILSGSGFVETAPSGSQTITFNNTSLNEFILGNNNSGTSAGDLLGFSNDVGTAAIALGSSTVPGGGSDFTVDNGIAGASVTLQTNGGNLVFKTGPSSTALTMNSSNVSTFTNNINAPSFMSTGTTFTDSGCSTSTLKGGSTAGSFVSGTTGTCTVTITMGSSQTANNGWYCGPANDLTTNADSLKQTATTTTTVTLSGTTVSGDVINFACFAY